MTVPASDGGDSSPHGGDAHPRASSPSAGDPTDAAREARFQWELPRQARVIALVYEKSEAERSATAIDAVATAIGRRREHAVVLSTEAGPFPLDEVLGSAESPGWPAALGGSVRLTDVAVQFGDRPFVYMPAGDDEDGVRRMMKDDSLAAFVSRVRDRSGTLFLVLPDGRRLPGKVGEQIDGYVAIGEATFAGAGGDAHYGRVRLDMEGDPSGQSLEQDGPPATPPAAPRAPESRAAWRAPDSPAAPRRSAPARLLIASVCVLAVLFGGWWAYDNMTEAGARAASGSGPGIAARDAAGGAAPETAASGPEEGAMGSDNAARTPSGGQGDDGSRADPADAVEDARARGGGEMPSTGADEAAVGSPGTGAVEGAVDQPFSVLVASYATTAEADDHLAQLGSGSPGPLYFIAPTFVRERVYYRVFAGALESRSAASALMDILLLVGEKEDATPWHIRAVRHAYDLGRFDDPASAEARIGSLSAQGIPAYPLEVMHEGRIQYQIYGGAYESGAAALPLAETLEAVGEPAVLVLRRGNPSAAYAR